MTTLKSLNSNMPAWLLSGEGGGSLLEFDSFIAFEVRDEGQTLSEPTEEGGFATYNKTNTPLEAYVTLGKGGTDDERQVMIEKLQELKSGATKFSIITPFNEYENMTMQSFNHSHTREEGSKILLVELHVVEVRGVSPQYTTVALPQAQCKNPEDASNIDRGKINPQETSVAFDLGLGGIFG